MTFGFLIQFIQDSISDMTDPTRGKIQRAINFTWQQVAAMRDWEFMKREKELSTTDLTADVPLVLPANFIKAIGTIKDGDNAYIFSPSMNRVPLNNYYNWFFDDPVTAPLESGTSVAVAANGTDVTSTAEFGTDDISGEFIRIGDNLGVYEIDEYTDASNLTLVHGFRGDTIQSGESYFEIRPTGTKQINFCDQAGDFEEPDAPILVYTEQPLPLYNDWDVMDMPGNATVMFFKSLKTVAMQKGWTRLAQSVEKDFIESFADVQREEPSSQERIKASGRFRFHSRRRGLIFNNLQNE